MAQTRVAGEERREGNGIDAAVVRTALCVRIRTLGESILAITRAAAEEVAELDREFAEMQLARRNKRHSQPRCPSPLAAPPCGKSNRLKKSTSMPAPAGRVSVLQQERVTTSTVTPRGRSAPRPQGTPGTAKTAKSRKSFTPPYKEVPAPAPAGRGKSNQGMLSVKMNPALTTSTTPTPTPSTITTTTKGGGGDAETDASSSAVKISSTHDDPNAENESEHSRALDDVAAVCAAAEANYEIVRATWCRRADDGGAARSSSSLNGRHAGADDGGLDVEAEEEGSSSMPKAPLYDRSNAAIVAPHGAPQARNGDSGDAGLSASVVTAGGVESLTARAAAGAPAVPLPAQAEEQALAELQIVPDQSTVQSELRANAATTRTTTTTTTATTKPAPAAAAASMSIPSDGAAMSPLRSYYNVVYIHKSTQLPRLNGREGGHDAGRTGAQPPRGAPQLRQSPTAMEAGENGAPLSRDFASEAPLLMHSYVSAMYAAEHHTGRPANLSGKSTSSTGDTALVTLDLRIPTSNSLGGVDSPVAASASETAPASEATSVVVSQVMTPVSVKVSSSLSAEPRERSPATTKSLASASRAAPASGSTYAEVDARIESIEDWQRDRHAYVEDRIRRRRRSSLASGAWQGDFYYAVASSLKAPMNLPTGAATSSATPTAASALKRPRSSVLPGVVAVPNKLTLPPTPHSVDGDAAERSSSQLTSQVPRGSAPYYVVDAAVPLDKATTYAVLLQADSAFNYTAAAAEQSPTARGAVDASAQAAGPVSPATASLVESSTMTPTTATVSMSSTPMATAKTGRCPRLEVVVASTYNVVEWAFSGAARRASDTAREQGAAQSPVVCASPFWVAHQRREREQEEQRRRSTRTRQPHGLDICTPISVALRV